MTVLDDPDRSAAISQYREAAPTYDRHMRLYRHWQSMAIDRLELRPGETVIDVACGTGLNIPALQAAVGPSGRIVGVDLSPEMLAHAHIQVRQAGWQNVTLIRSAIEDADFSGSADAALFSFTHDVLQSPAAVANVVAHLRRGARVASVGARLPGRWNPLMRWTVRRAARRYVSTFRGLDAPWRDLQSFAPHLLVRTVGLGGAYVAWGAIETLPDRGK